MDFLKLAKQRYSVREFSNRAIEKDTLDVILEAGRVAPTAANNQPQRIIVVQSREGLEKLGNAAFMYDAPLALVVCSDVEAAWRRPYDDKLSVDIDASIITTHMMLQATELGLGSVWICYFKPEVLRSEFAIPSTWIPVNILALGYAKGEPLSPDRHDSERLPKGNTIFYDNM